MAKTHLGVTRQRIGTIVATLRGAPSAESVRRESNSSSEQVMQETIASTRARYGRFHWSISSRTSWRVLFSLIIACAGCNDSPPPSFTAAEATAELPELHQKNIADGLKAMFGTPSQPRLLLSVPVDPAATTEDDLEEDDDEPAEQVDVSEVVTFLQPDRLNHGARVYSQRCAGCHGAAGDGNGEAAAYLRPKPRDYRKGIYKFTSTNYGQRPTRQDLVRTIRRGAKGTSMPAFPWMAEEDLEAVIDYVIYFSLRGQVEQYAIELSEDYDEDEPMDNIEFEDGMSEEVSRWTRAQGAPVTPISAEPSYDEGSVEMGRRLFIKSSCYNCHGEDAKGQTEWLSPEFLAAQEAASQEVKVQINYDAWGDPAPAANITARMLHGGRRPLDIYRRIFTGINGTPMPQYGANPDFADKPEDIWHLVHYVMHIVDGGDPTLGISVADVQAAEEEKAAAEATSQETEEQ